MRTSKSTFRQFRSIELIRDKKKKKIRNEITNCSSKQETANSWKLTIARSFFPFDLSSSVYLTLGRGGDMVEPRRENAVEPARYRVIKRRVTRALYIIQTGVRSVIARHCFCATSSFPCNNCLAISPPVSFPRLLYSIAA